MNLLVLSSHGILEYDDLRLFTDLGYTTFMPGGYSNPATPGETLRPALPNVPYYADLDALCHAQRVKHEGQPTEFGIIDWAKADLHPYLLAWADVVMVNCFPDTWIGYQWERLKASGKRIIWRTIGQSSPMLEQEMKQYRAQGLEIVRYSPAEQRAFAPLGAFAGEDAMIRFAKYPSDFGPWIGDKAVVGNVTQHMDTRGDHCGLAFWQATTEGLPVQMAGLGSETLGGIGTLTYPAMLDYFSHLRVYLYLGTQPASYTLALMEVMLAGVPVVSIGPRQMWLPALFEGHEIAVEWADHPHQARDILTEYLREPDVAASEFTRERAVDLFGNETVGAQWLDYLGAP